MRDQSPNDERSSRQTHRGQNKHETKHRGSGVSAISGGQAQREELFFGGMVAPDTPVSEAGSETAMRLQAYSQVMATTLVREVPFIERFRHEHLPHGEVLPPNQLFDWVAGQAVADGEYTLLLRGLPRDAFLEQDDGSWVLPKVWVYALFGQADLKDLPIVYKDIGDRLRIYQKHFWILRASNNLDVLNAEAVPVRLGGVLDKLCSFARSVTMPEYLAVEDRLPKYWVWRNDPSIVGSQRDLWDEARIATFVLTGHIPLLSEEQLPPPTGRGNRLQTAKHLQLAVFTAQHAAFEEESLQDRMEMWNAQYPEWTYERTSHFGWDTMQAIRRLLQITDAQRAALAPSTPSSRAVLEWIEQAVIAGSWQEAPGERLVKTSYSNLMNEIVRRKTVHHSDE